MSFMKALASVAVGFAAAKGVDKYRKIGGMAGMQDMFKQAGGAGGMASGMADQMAQMAEKMGVPGGGKAVRDLMNSFGGGAMTGGDGAAATAGLGGLMTAFGSAATATGQQMDDALGGIFANTPVSLAAENNAKLMIRAMIQAAKADGQIDKDEQKKILDHLKDAPPEEVAFVKAQLAAPLDIASLANDAGESVKAQVYATSLMAVRVDTDAEVAYLRQLSTALGISDDARDAVHAAMGVPPLPKA